MRNKKRTKQMAIVAALASLLCAASVVSNMGSVKAAADPVQTAMSKNADTDFDSTNNFCVKFGGSAGNDYFYDVAVAEDGYVAVGYSEESSFESGDWDEVKSKGQEDAIIVKYDTSGHVKWKKNFGGSYDERFYSIATVQDGYVAVGRSFSTATGDGDLSDIPCKGYADGILVKYDTEGNLLWKKTFGGNDWDEYNSVEAVDDGYIVVGTSVAESFGNGDWSDTEGKGDKDAIIVKYDLEGNVQWSGNFGGNGSDEFQSVAATADGYVAAGSVSGLSFGNGDLTDIVREDERSDIEAIIVKYDKDGNILWKKNYGGSNYDAFWAVAADDDGYVAVGDTYQEPVAMNGMIVKYDTEGNILWTNEFGGTNYDTFHGVAAVQGGYVVAGGSVILGDGDWTGTGMFNSFFTCATLVKYNTAGFIEWKGGYEASNGEFWAIEADSESCIAASASSPNSSIYRYGNLLKLNNLMEKPYFYGSSETDPTIQIDYMNEKLTGFEEGADYSIIAYYSDSVSEETGEWRGYLTSHDGEISLSNDLFGAQMEISKHGNGITTVSSMLQIFDIPLRPEMPKGLSSADAEDGKNNGKITGLSKEMEYRKSTDKEWTACTGVELTGLAAGTYEIRLKATDSSFAGKAAEVMIKNTIRKEESSDKKPSEHLAVGSSFTYKNGVYKVTKLSAAGNQVVFVKPSQKKNKRFTIPASVSKDGLRFEVTAIANNAFKGNKELEQVIIGTKVKTIGANAFGGDIKLKKITIKSNVLSKVGKKAFRGIHAKCRIKVLGTKKNLYKKLLKNKGQKATVKIV